MENLKRRGRPKGTTKSQKEVVTFDPKSIKLIKGSQLNFHSSLFKPMKTKRELDIILSTEGGLMPGTNIVICGGPGSGKSTIVMDMLSDFTRGGKKCLFVSGEMDEVGYYKYCKRMPKFNNITTLFLKNHTDNVKEVLEHVFDQGWDVIAIDSIAEVVEMVKDNYKMTEGASEGWFLSLQDKVKKGENKSKIYTTFVNIQQVTKAGDFAGSNRLKHMTEGMAHIERSKDGLERSIYFSKNRDCDKDFKMYFTFHGEEVHYSYETVSENE